MIKNLNIVHVTLRPQPSNLMTRRLTCSKNNKVVYIITFK